MVDWIEALRVGVFGFLTVFVVLVVLAVALWLQSNILYRVLHRKEQQKQKNKSQE